MSEEKSTGPSGLAAIIDTLKNNPKALYAAGGAIVVVFLAMTLGGNDGQIGEAKVAPLTIGQTIKIENPNIGNTVLVAVPKLGSSDSEDDDTIICRVVAPGTSATVEEESTVNYIPFVKVTLKDGECQGKTGWLPKVNVASK
jgi:hypothetical protein